jgi:hypothetical protein
VLIRFLGQVLPTPKRRPSVTHGLDFDRNEGLEHKGTFSGEEVSLASEVGEVPEMKGETPPS